MIKFWWPPGSSSGYRDCFPDSSLLGDTESGRAINRLRCATLQCRACTSRHRHSNYDVITSPTLGGGVHCPSISSLTDIIGRAYQRNGRGRISARRSDLFLWLPLPAPAPVNYFTPAHRSAPAHQVFGPLRSRSVLMFQATNWKSGPIFTARRCCASAVLGVVILSVRPSVCHTHALWLIQRTYRRYFYTIWKGNPFCHPTVVGGLRPLPPKMGDRSDPPSFKNRSRQRISACNASTVRAGEKKFNYDE